MPYLCVLPPVLYSSQYLVFSLSKRAVALNWCPPLHWVNPAALITIESPLETDGRVAIVFKFLFDSGMLKTNQQWNGGCKGTASESIEVVYALEFESSWACDAMYGLMGGGEGGGACWIDCCSQTCAGPSQVASVNQSILRQHFIQLVTIDSSELSTGFAFAFHWRLYRFPSLDTAVGNLSVVWLRLTERPIICFWFPSGKHDSSDNDNERVAKWSASGVYDGLITPIRWLQTTTASRLTFQFYSKSCDQLQSSQLTLWHQQTNTKWMLKESKVEEELPLGRFESRSTSFDGE